MATTLKKKPVWLRGVFVGPLVGVIVLVLMGFSTTFVSSQDQAVAADTAAEWVELNFQETVVPTILDRAVAVDELLARIVADPDKAGEDLGRREDDAQPYSYATEATGMVNGDVFGEILLDVPGLPGGMTVGIAVPPLGSATSLRDAGTELSFGDFANQTEYQKVAVELNNRVADSVYGDVAADSLQGKQVKVTGAFTWTSKTGGKIDHVTIIPVSIEVQ